jgi:hypothetical protein
MPFLLLVPLLLLIAITAVGGVVGAPLVLVLRVL